MIKITDRVILGIDPGTRILGFGIIHIVRGVPHFVDMGVVNLIKERDHFVTLRRITHEVSALINRHAPDEMAIEAPFYGKNPQVMLKLGRAQGAAIAAAHMRDIPIFEYAPRSVKVAVTGQGAASKEQVATMAQKELDIDIEERYLDATDALAIALCHFYHISNPILAEAEKNNPRNALLKAAMGKKRAAKSWEDFAIENPGRITK